jgi:iron complex outermembrane receptor protein
LAANNPGNPFGQPVLAFYRFADLGPRQFGADNQSTRVLAGAKGQWNTHDWEFALGEAKTDSEQSAGNLVRQAPWTTLVDAGTFTLFQPNSAATLNAVRGSTTRVGETKTRVADARLSGNTPWRLAAPIGYAAGIEYRRESQRDAPLAEQSDGTLAGFGSTNDAFSAARNATAVFGELALPLLKNLDAQVAVRHERYSDFGSSTNPKLGLKYLPTPRLALRASGGTSFRAPSLIEANYPVSAGIDGLIQDTTRCRALGIAFSDCPATVVELALSSDPAIGPEKGRNYTPGAVFQPMAQFSAALDYVYIKYTDKIGLNYFSTFPPNGGPVDERFVTRGVPAPGDPAGVPAPITDVTLLYTNAFGQSIYKGYDFELEGRFDAAGGRIGIELSGTYLDSFRQTTDSSSAPQSQAGLLFYPRLRSTLSTSYTRGDWTGTLNINYVSRQRDTDNELEPEPGLVGEDITVDTQVQYSGIRNLKLSLGARNLFDRDPPRSESFSAGFNPTLSNPRGRFVYARLSYRFL